MNQQETHVIAAYDKFVDGVMTVFSHHDKPEILYHYTNDLAGCTGIIRSKTMWARDAQNFGDRDRRELQHADELILDAAAELRPTLSGTSRHVLDHFIASFPQLRASANPFGAHVFVASFTQAKDAPNMWQSYGGNGQGCCLGIRILREDGVAIPGTGMQLIPVEYDANAQRTRVLNCFRGILQKLQTVTRGRREKVVEDLCWEASRGLWRAAMQASVATKEPAQYADEQEWRWTLFTLLPNDALSFVPGSTTRIAIPMRKPPALVWLSSLHVGAQLGAAGLSAVEGLLREEGYGVDGVEWPALSMGAGA